MVGVIHVAVITLVVFLTERVGFKIVRVIKVSVFVVFMGVGMIVVVGWAIVAG